MPNTCQKSEKWLERYLQKEVKKLGGESFKWTSVNRRGVPDRIVVLPINNVTFWEVKSLGKKPTPIQLHMHHIFKAIGVEVYVVDSKKKIDVILKEVTNVK